MLRGKHHKVSLLPSDPDIHLDGHSTEKGDFYECLGVQVDETLLWSSHFFPVLVLKLQKFLGQLEE